MLHHLTIAAGDSARFTIPLDPAHGPENWHCAVTGVPSAWVKTASHASSVEVHFTVPRHTAMGTYPLGVVLTEVDEPDRRMSCRLALEILPPARRSLSWRDRVASPPVLMAAGFVAVLIWLGFSFWRGARPVGTAATAPLIAADTVAAPIWLPPPVLIGAEWSAGLSTPIAGPTPTLRPTLTPLPPMPTPQPPPLPPAEPARAVETGIHAPYTYQLLFQEVGAQFSLDWRLLASIADSESSLNPAAIGRSGEQGIMQIMPATWRQFAPPVGESDPFDPYASARVSAYYLTYLRDYLYSQGYTETYWLLVAYNWGPNNLRQHLAARGDWGGIPPLRQNYANTIIGRINDPTSPLWTIHLLAEVPP